jgi:PEP-CTERM motif
VESRLISLENNASFSEPEFRPKETRNVLKSLDHRLLSSLLEALLISAKGERYSSKGRQLMVIRSVRAVLIGALTCCLGFFFSGSAKADPIQLSCAACSPGSVSLVSSGGSVTFNFIGEGTSETGSAYIGILVPTGGGAPSLSLGGSTVNEEESATLNSVTKDLGTTLNESFTDYNLSTFQSASEQAGVDPSSYTAYEYFLGNNVTLGGGTGNLASLQASGLTQGTVIVGWLEGTSKGTLQTPLSESVAGGITAVPEPSTFSFFSIGLLGLAGVSFIRYRRFGTMS